MRFGPVPLAEAEGAILAHSQATPTGRIRKGRVLSAQDVATLQDAGLDEVTVARLGPGDCHEDAAAERLSRALIGNADGLRASRATTGRVNIYATGPGVLALDVASLNAFNRVNPMITVATLPPFAPVAAGRMVATVKIISYGVAESLVAQAAQGAAGAIGVHPLRLRSAVLILTEMAPGAEPDPLTLKGRDAIRQRLEALGVALTDCVVVAHDEAAIACALGRLQGELALILTASATSDPDDLAPSAVRRAGGTVARFGMPVDPGNLLFVGAQDGRPVIGLPGCARSPALNGADWVLERVVCGIDVGDADIAAMGVGGLLKESPARPHPRERPQR